MAITLADVKSPAGDVDPAVWFPGKTSGEVDTLLTGYIADAYTQTTDDDAAEQWVYYRAATAVADTLGGSSSSKTLTWVDQGSKTVSSSTAQTDYWERKALAYLDAFNELTAEDTTEAAGGFNALTSLRHA